MWYFYLLLMMISIAVNFVVGEKIGTKRAGGRRRGWLLFGLIYNFGWLFLFKYLDFMLENINMLSVLAGSEKILPQQNLVLPIGISFYTFQIVSYLFDVYRKEVRPEASVISLGTYLCMFPQLIAGPIVSYISVAAQLKRRKHSIRKIDEGLRIFTIGLGKVLNKVPLLGHLYMCFMIPFTWLFFAITDLNQLKIYLIKLLPFLGNAKEAAFTEDYLKFGKIYAVTLFAGLLFCTGLPAKLYHKLRNNMLSVIALLAVFWMSVYCMYIGMDDPFLYFRF